MHLAAILLTLVVHAGSSAPAPAVPASPTPHHGIEAVLTISLEQVALGGTATTWTFEWEALAHRLTLKASPKLSTTSADIARVVKQLARHPVSLCPHVKAIGSSLVFECSSPLLQMGLRTQQTTRFLEIREVRGLPWRGMAEDIIARPFEPSTVGLGEACPGTSVLGKAECALARGDREKAIGLYREASKGSGSPLAHVRLGDIALLAGDTTAALSDFEAGAADGPFGRLAKVRVCEMTGSCFGNHPEKLFELRNVPGPLAAEMTLRQARMEAFLGKPADGVRHLTERPEACRPAAIGLCQRILLAALESPSLDGDALPLFLSSSLRDEAPLRLQLAQAASEAALRVGAPAFAATLLSAATPAASSAELPAHLLRVAQLYRMADDDVRASVVLDFAASRFGPAMMKKPEWRRLQSRAPATKSLPPAANATPSTSSPLEDEAAPDLARALLARTRASRFSSGAAP